MVLVGPSGISWSAPRRWSATWALCIKGRWGNLPLRPLLSAIHRLPFFFLYDFLVLHLKTLPLLSSLGTPPYVLDACHRFMNHPIKPTRALKFTWLKRLLKKATHRVPHDPACAFTWAFLSTGMHHACESLSEDLSDWNVISSALSALCPCNGMTPGNLEI